MTSRDVADFELMRAAQRLEADPIAAAAAATRVLTEFPEHLEASLLLVGARRRLGDPAGALAVLGNLPAGALESAFLQLELGRAYAACGKGAEALAAFRGAVALDPGLADAWREFATSLFDSGETIAGDEAYARFTRLSPEPPELRDASLALGENRIEAAEAMLRTRIAQVPSDVAALRMLADLEVRREEYAKAERRLTVCLNLAPGYAAARYDLAELLQTLHRHAESLPLIERLLASDPANLDYLSLKAQVLRMTERNDEALELMARAVAAHPAEDRAWLLFGHLLREVGQQARAIEMYRRALEVRPTSGRAYVSLANLKTFRFAAGDLATMQEQLNRRTVRGLDRTNLEFALGKALEDAGNFATSFEHYARGNALYRATMPYDPQAMIKDVERLKALYTAQFFARRAGWGSACVGSDLHRGLAPFWINADRAGSRESLPSRGHARADGRAGDRPRLMSAPRTRRPAGISGIGRRALDRREIRDVAERYLERTQLPPRARQATLRRQDARQFRPSGLAAPDVPAGGDHRRAPPPARLRLLLLQAALRTRPRLLV